MAFDDVGRKLVLDLLLEILDIEEKRARARLTVAESISGELTAEERDAVRTRMITRRAVCRQGIRAEVQTW